MQFCAAAKKAGVQPIVGAHAGAGSARGRSRAHPAGRPEPEHLVLLVKDAQGYGNLLRLMSRAYVAAEAGGPSQVSLAERGRHTAGPDPA